MDLKILKYKFYNRKLRKSKYENIQIISTGMYLNIY